MATTSITVTEPPVLIASSSAASISCNGAAAVITVTATGGTASYSGTGDFTRSAGAYSFTVSDAGGCMATPSITGTEPPVLITSSSAAFINCKSTSAVITLTAN